MSDGDALLAAVKAYPDDDTPRLVYADWCDDNNGETDCPACHGTGFLTHHAGTADAISFADRICPPCRGDGRVPNRLAARAAFIRASVELARTPRWASARCHATPDEDGGGSAPADDNPEWLSLKQRTREMYYSHGHPGWWPAGGALAMYAPNRGDMPEDYFERGFLSRVTCAAADWLAHADAILDAHPVRRVTLTTMPIVETEIDGSVGLIGDPMDEFWWPDDVEAKSAELGLPREDDPDAAERHSIHAMLALRWPGVAFELPPVGASWDTSNANPVADLRALLHRVAGGMRESFAGMMPAMARACDAIGQFSQQIAGAMEPVATALSAHNQAHREAIVAAIRRPYLPTAEDNP